MPNLASLLQPLSSLLHQQCNWKWTPECTKVSKLPKILFSLSKGTCQLWSYVTIAADTSVYGLGAVISHIFPDRLEQPIAFDSRTLIASECNYVHIAKEALALVFVTDHIPFMTTLGPKKGIPSLAAARLQRWTILFSGYRYEIEFRPTHISIAMQLLYPDLH